MKAILWRTACAAAILTALSVAALAAPPGGPTAQTNNTQATEKARDDAAQDAARQADALARVQAEAHAAAQKPAVRALVTVEPGHAGAEISDQVLGANFAFWFDPTQAGVAEPIQKVGLKMARWSNGALTDEFDWRQHKSVCTGKGVNPNATDAAFFHAVAIPDHLTVSMTVNYGTNAACNAGGDPAEAAAWVADLKAKGLKVAQWTVGNENYGGWEPDKHPLAHDPETYAREVAEGFYPKMKAADPETRVGVSVAPDFPAWDKVVLAKAKYDYVEMHYYAQQPGKENDDYLVGDAALDFGDLLAKLKAELAAAGHADTPIYLGELGSISTGPVGKQTQSITQALFAGQVIAEMMTAGVRRATWWLAYGGCDDDKKPGGNFSKDLYGWQTFGSYTLFSDGLPNDSCPKTPTMPRGMIFPTARAFEVMRDVAVTGEHMVEATTQGASGNLRAYAATHGDGYAIVLFNVSRDTPILTAIDLKGVDHASDVALTVYGRAQYDKTITGVWAGPNHVDLGPRKGPLAFTVPPWTMVAVFVKK